jgi:hypothetical protein
MATRIGVSNKSLFAEFLVHFVVIRSAEADVADPLDFTAHSHAAFGAGDETGDAADGEWQECGDAQRAEADAQSTPCAAVHEVAKKQSSRGSQERRSRERAGFNPCRC